MTDDEIRKAIREGYRQDDNLRRSPFVVLAVLLIMVLTAVLGVVL